MNVFELASAPAALNGQNTTSTEGAIDSSDRDASTFKSHLSKEVQEQEANTQAPKGRDQESASRKPLEGEGKHDSTVGTESDLKSEPNNSAEFVLTASVRHQLEQPRALAAQMNGDEVAKELMDDELVSIETEGVAAISAEALLSTNTSGQALGDSVLEKTARRALLPSESVKNERTNAELSNIPSLSKSSGLSEASAVRLDATSNNLSSASSGESAITNALGIKMKNDGNSPELSFSDIFESELPDSKSTAQTRAEAQSSLTSFTAPKTEGLSGLPAARFSVNVQFGRAEWMADVASQVSKVAAQNLNFAEIQLDPPELGPLQVRVQVNNDQATVSFTAQSQQVREALEQNGNRLRELFDGEGLNLVDVDVSDQNQHNGEDELESERADQQGEADVSNDTLLSDSSVLETEIQVGVDDYV